MHNNNRKFASKIPLGKLKGKSATTSVPSIAVRFNATAEEIEELYAEGDDTIDVKFTTNASASITNTASDPESSPLRSYLRLTKRSTSIDVSPISSQDASPPSDSWKFLSDIKSKITKSVEDRITEYKTKKEMEQDGKTKETFSNNKEQLQSDSEDESSISKTCGIISTSDGVELSTDEDTSSDQKKKVSFKDAAVQQKEATTSTTNKVKLDDDEQLDEDEEVEDGVEAVEELFKEGIMTSEFKEKWADFQEVNEQDFKTTFYEDNTKQHYISFNPPNHVDLRPRPGPFNWWKFVKSFRYAIIFISIIGLKLFVEMPDYLCGFITGSCATITTVLIYVVYGKIYELLTAKDALKRDNVPTEAVTIPPVKEYTPLTKYEGWVNEYPQFYNPHTYHISQTQSVYLKLKGNLLRISHTKSKIPKRSMWNEPSYNVILTHHRIYNLLGAKITILPEGLARGKRWSKKYPICISLASEQDNVVVKNDDKDEVSSSTFNMYMQMSNIKDNDDEKEMGKDKHKEKRKDKHKEKDINNKIIEDTDESQDGHEADTEDDPDNFDVTSEDADDEADTISFQGEHQHDQQQQQQQHEQGKKTKLYMFGRTDREKEMWFRRFVEATHKGAQYTNKQKLNPRDRHSISRTLIQDAKDLHEFNKLMVFCSRDLPYIDYKSLSKLTSIGEQQLHKEIYEAMNKEIHPNVKWVNSLVGRVLYDCVRNPEFSDKIKERIQKKLAAIKLPYFIEDLVITELNLGTDIPLIHNCTNPIVDDSGVWIDFEITYSGLVTLILNTKLNLLKITTRSHADDEPIDEKSHPMFNSDIDDTAESSTDDEYAKYPPALDSTGYPVHGLGGTSTTSKKIIRIVDKVAESKLFQAATENKYIKKAIENVSNTELGLKLEVRALVATLVVNIPPPPSDRIWMSFRPLPKLQILAMPIVGVRNINYMKVTSFLEKKLIQEIHKIFVLPNMEDVTFTLMSSKLPE